MHCWTILDRAARQFPNEVAVVDSGQHYTYAEVAARCGSIAAFLRDEGVRKGDRVSILGRNSHVFLETYFAVAGLGAISNPLNVRLLASDLITIMRDAESSWLVADVEFHQLALNTVKDCPSVQGIVWVGKEPSISPTVNSVNYDALVSAPNPVRFDPVVADDVDVAHLYYTSGTTGVPKGVMLSHRNVTAHALGAIAELGLRDDDVWGHIAPMFHLADAWATFAITWVGGQHVMIPRFDPTAVLRSIQEHRITITNLVPTMLNALAYSDDVQKYDTSSLRAMLSGGAPIARSLVERTATVFDCDYVQTYGMTETSPYLTLSILTKSLRRLTPSEQSTYRAKTGRPFLLTELRVVREDGSHVRTDDKEVGEIWVRGETVTAGYWRRPEETQARIVDGWLRTGDLATVDEKGYLTIVDRVDDVIISGGENVFSTEVENVIAAHPAVFEVAVFGEPHEHWGELVAAALVIRDGQFVDEAELKSFCEERLAGFKSPKRFVFLDSLPKTGSGKISKHEIRRRFSS